ncbi:MAG: hypothetical protein GIKADHBN_02729 [Phycisphaerales bacterium]|nr:hypothetical protein [Phycisphaerales bacterium]
MAAGSGPPVAVQVRAQEGVINLKSGDVAVAGRASQLNEPAFSAHARHLVVLDGPLDQRRRSLLAKAGVVVGEYLPTHACIADVSRASPAALRQLAIVRWVGAFDDAWKLARGIGSRRYEDPQRQALRDQGLVALNLVLFHNTDADRAETAIAAVPGVTLLGIEHAGTDVLISALAPVGQLAALAAVPEVGWIEEKPSFIPRAYASRWILQRNEKDDFPLYDAGLRGEGQILGIIDGWVSVLHCAFSDPNIPITEPGVYPDHRKIYAYNAETLAYNLHGTLVAGIALGDAGDDTAETRGVAYLSRMVFNTWPGFTEDSIYSRFMLHYSQGAAVHSNSWGSPDSTEYDFAARAVDNFSWLNPDNLVIYAVSNGEIILNPENAKNCVAVTSTGSEGGQDSMCNLTGDPSDKPGRGPTTDGRRKPEIAAPGCSVWSTSGQTCSVRWQDGTSMAAPAVAGIATLMRQYFQEGFYPHGRPHSDLGFTPSGSLLKAMILNAGVDLAGEPGYPNDYEGWGRLQADDSLYFEGDARRTIVRDIRPGNPWSLATGQSFFVNLEVDSADEPFRVTLVFHDAPAALQASYAPVNDLDLVVTSPSGEKYAGNLFANGFSIAGTDNDPLNNAEQVLVPEPETGLWTIEVRAREVNVGPTQSFAVVATGAVNEACRADFDRSAFLDTEDFDGFVEAFIDGHLSADFDGNGHVEFDDFDQFVKAFEKGC